MTYSNFDKKACRQLRDDLQKVLDAADIDGLTFELGNMRFNKTSCKIQLLASTDADAEVKSDEIAQIVMRYGLKSSDTGEWVIVAFRPNSPKYPIVAEKNGKGFKLSIAHARGIFGTTD